jgi:hypothetical protein
MDLAQSHETLERALAPATATLEQQQSRSAFRLGLAGGVQLLPRFAAILVLGWLGASFVATRPIFEPLLLPLLLLVPPFGAALAFRAAARRQSRIDAATAAVALDRANRTKDRLSAALELSADPRSTGTGRPAALARAAVADGLETLPRVDVHDPALGRSRARLRPSWASALVALFLTLVPAVLRIGPAAPGTGTDEIPVAAGETPAAGEDRAPPAAADPSAAEPDAAEARTPQPERPARPDTPPKEPTDEPAEPPPPAEARRPRGAGAGAAGSEPTSERGQRAPTAGETQTTNAGAATASGQGGGGQGAAKSETPSEPSEPRAREDQKPKPQRPKQPSETEGGEQERSAGNPSGPSRGGGKMAAVGNQRSGMERGRERDDDPDTDEEDVEDEKEETEQRGGVMPMTRDRMQAPSRELSISGNGPPDDGRGGPTPPKKSRGTASLVLGVRLPDQIRGQTNPGTAKTTIEQIPPVPQDEPARPTSPAPSAGPSPHVQSPAAPLGGLGEAVRRYHELLRSRAPRTGSADAEPSAENQPTRDA